MTNFDPSQFQIIPNGPLRPEVIKRIVDIRQRHGLSYASLGDKFGFSGTFVHNLLNKSFNVNTRHIQRLMAAVDLLENGDAKAPKFPAEKGMLAHSFHLRPDLQVKIELPADLSEREADRLARFIQSLPVA
jgi:transcriptional regulator with XRE-family HTH domain